MQQASLQISSWVSLQQANAQTAVNKTKRKSQTLNTQLSSLQVVRLTYLSSADAILSPVAVSDIEINWLNKIQRISIAFIDVNSNKFAYGTEIE